MTQIVNTTGTRLPPIPFKAIKEAALGKNYDLTVTILAPAKMRSLNNMYRNRNKPTDILSFPLSKKEGEIFITPSEVRKEARKFARPYENFFAFVFIHGCTHLKGLDHGDRMERLEAKLRAQFKV